MTRQVTLTCHEMGQENCSQVPCWIINGRRVEWIRRWIRRWYITWYWGTTGMARYDDGGGVSGCLASVSSSFAAGGVLPPRNHSRTCSLALQRRLSLLARSHQVLFITPPSSNERKLEALIVVRRAHSAIVSKSQSSNSVAAIAPSGDERPSDRLRA